MTHEPSGAAGRASATRRSLLALGAGGLLAGGVAAQAGATTASTSTNTPAWFNVAASPFNADPTGVQDSTTAFAAAIAAAASAGGGVVYIPTGRYLISRTLTCTAVPVYFMGDGPWASVISFTGTGDCFRVYDSSPYDGRTKFGGGFAGVTIDGAQAGPASSGLHLGDLLQYELDLTVQNFTGAGSVGVLLDNAYFWTEQLYGRIYAQNCASHVVFDWTVGSQSTSSGSFERCDLDIYVNQQNPAFDGVVLRNGAFIGNGSLKIRGNFNSGTTAVTSAALRLTGSQSTATYSSASGIVDSMVDIGVECPTHGSTPQTIVFGSAGNTVRGCSGALNFSLAGMFSRSNNVGNVQGFLGHITGDTSLPSDVWRVYSTGFPAGISGHVALRFLPTGGEVMVSWGLDVAAGTVLQSGQAIVTVDGGFAYSDNKVIPGNCLGGGLNGNVYAPAFLTATAAFTFEGPSYKSSGDSWWYGQGVYTLSLG